MAVDYELKYEVDDQLQLIRPFKLRKIRRYKERQAPTRNQIRAIIDKFKLEIL